MKRITTLLLALVMCLGSVATARAVDVKASGTWDFAYSWIENSSFRSSSNGGQNDDVFGAYQRFRTQVNFIASERLQGVLAFEIGTLRWGSADYDGAKGGALDADGVNVETRRAYLDWMIPNTDATVRMGIQGVSLPFATELGCNPVFSADVAGIVVSSPITDMLGVTAFWLRPFDAYGTDPNDRHYDDETDLFGLTLPVTGEGWSVTPWAMYGNVGATSGFYDYLFFNDGGITNQIENENAAAWWAGVAFKLDVLDPLTFSLDAMYGHLDRANVSGVSGLNFPTESDNMGIKGWFVASALDYKLSWATPGIFGWYSSGDDADAYKDGKLGRLPVVGTDDGFGPTSFGFPGSMGPVGDSYVSVSGTGTWGVGARLADISFIENLSHTLRVTYYQGTNNVESAKYMRQNERLNFVCDAFYLSTSDHAWEVNFDHTYQIYENLAAYLELGYIDLSLDKGVWGDDARDTDDAWKAQVGFQYSF